MGRLSLDGMLETTDAETAFAWHMAHNLYPPPPPELHDICWAAIQAFNAGEIGLDDDYDFNPVGEVQPFRHAVEAFRLDTFLQGRFDG